MIFCSGVPGTPSKDDVLTFWARKGFWTFFPRYRGTWESEGTFLGQSLEQDILDVVDGLRKRFKDFWSGKSFKVVAKEICIVGSSFGGPAAILATLDTRVQKAICISPVVDWKAENKAEPLPILYDFLKRAYGGAYRLDKRLWSKLARGNFYNPVKHLQKLDGDKILIFHARDDKVVRFNPVARFAEKTDCHFVALKRGGHLSSSMLTSPRYYWKVKRFLLS